MISVITSAYNAENTLPRTVQSVLGQSCRDFEYIIVDHGSADGTGAIIEEFAAADGRVRKITLQENSGFIGRALNCALEEARGEYVAFLDADDAYEPEFLETMLGHINGGYDIAVCGFRRVDENDAVLRTDTIGEAVQALDKASYRLLWEQFLTHSFGYLYVWWNKLYRRDYLEQRGFRFPEDCFVHGDALFQARLLAEMPRMYCSDQPMVRWSCVLGSASHGIYKRGYYKEAVAAACAFTELSERFTPDPGLYQQYCARLVLSLPHLRRLEHYRGTRQEKVSELIDWITYPPYWELIAKAGLQEHVRDYVKAYLAVRE